MKEPKYIAEWLSYMEAWYVFEAKNPPQALGFFDNLEEIYKAFADSLIVVSTLDRPLNIKEVKKISEV